jgi:hypothetical protein
MLIVGLVYWAVARRAHRTWHTALTDERREMRAEYSQRLYRVLEALDRTRPRWISPRVILMGSRRRIRSNCSRSGRPGAPARDSRRSRISQAG